ncbi:MAG: hypothetical protein WA125_15430, partial [Desulfosporosinus sp.]
CNRFIESKVSARETESNDVDAYDLIMRDKERLLSFEEPTRFIYDVINESFDANIFTRNNLNARVEQNELPFNKHIYYFVVTDSNIEKSFARDLDISKEVCVFAKLPRGFFIPTPVGQYNPDWAIVFHESAVKYIYFIAETKGSMDSLELRGIEEAKIHCARKHFEKLSASDFKYDVVSSYEKLLEIVK